ncbi:MAG TPA: hypothetical protein VF791_13485 [Pyrinomonadaceae bacterium]
MSRKLSPVSATLATAILALAVLVFAAPSATAQVIRGQATSVDVTAAGSPSLGCCKCLGGTNVLDLSTISSNSWTVNGSPVVFLAAIHPSWNLNPGPAKWVSTVANGGTSSVAAGPYEYRLDFVVPACSIDQNVTLSGNYGGDDTVSVFLDNTPLSQCTGGWCFNSPKKPLSTFTTTVGPGAHSLRVKVVNGSLSPSGMFVNAKLTGTCTDKLTKPR